MLTLDEILLLKHRLGRRVREQMYASNALHQALLAIGNEYAGWVVTSAIGQPADVAGALAIVQAGGAAIGLRIVRDDFGRVLKVDRVNALDIMGYDMLLAAHSATSLIALEDVVMSCLTWAPE